MIVHPVSGVVLDEDDVESLSRMEAAVDRYLRHQSRHYSFRRQLRERIAELRGPAELPRTRDRSDVQAKVGECPRCSRRYAR